MGSSIQPELYPCILVSLLLPSSLALCVFPIEGDLMQAEGLKRQSGIDRQPQEQWCVDMCNFSLSGYPLEG